MMQYTLSYWERETFFKRIDIAVIGSGIVGLTAAIRLKTLRPKLEVAVLERGVLPVGASTRNAGFACFGSMTELIDDLERSDEDTVLATVEKRWRGLQALRALTGDDAIDFYGHGGYEMFTDGEEAIFQACLERMPEFNAKIGAITGVREVYKTADERLPQFGFQGVRRLIVNTAEGQVNTGKMMHTLIGLALEKGVKIYNGIAIRRIEDTGRSALLETTAGWSVEIPQLLIATNGFAAQLLPQLDVYPARNQVLVTHPIPDLKVEGCFHYDRGYFYFRNIDGRILLGGGRNLDFETEQTDAFDANEKIRAALLKLLETVICPGRPAPVDAWWTGIMGLGPVKKPIVERVSPHMTVAVRMSGMGVAIGTLVGQEGAALALG